MWGCKSCSTKSKQIYKNIECAKEDGEYSDIILWDAVIYCKQWDQGIAMLDRGFDENSFPEGCHVRFFFPGDFFVIQHFKCYINLIDTCSESHDFEVPEGTNVSKEEIRTLCKSSDFVSPYRSNNMYANVFCHICNGEEFVRHFFCQKYYGILDGKGGKKGGFIALIDDKFITQTRDTDDTKNKVLSIACPVKAVS